MDGGQIAMSISKGRVYLDSSGVTLEGTLDILHLLQGVTHIGVSIRKRGRDSGNSNLFMQYMSLNFDMPNIVQFIKIVCEGWHPK